MSPPRQHAVYIPREATLAEVCDPPGALQFPKCLVRGPERDIEGMADVQAETDFVLLDLSASRSRPRTATRNRTELPAPHRLGNTSTSASTDLITKGFAAAGFLGHLQSGPLVLPVPTQASALRAGLRPISAAYSAFWNSSSASARVNASPSRLPDCGCDVKPRSIPSQRRDQRGLSA